MKKSFVLYHDFEATLNELSDEQAGKLLRATFAYSARGEIVDYGEIAVKLTMPSVRAQIDRDNEKYDKVCERNRKNGQLGGRKTETQSNPVGSSGGQSPPVGADSDSDSDSLSDSVFKTSSNSPREPEGVEQQKPAKKPKEDRPSACPPEKWEAYLSFSRKFHQQRHEALGNRAPFTEKKVLDGAKTLDVMCRVRGIDSKEIQAALCWAIEDSFWNEQVRALGSLLKIGSNGDTKYANILTAMAKDLVRK